MHDLVIQGGFVVDGTGAAGADADIVIDGEHISAVGPGAGRGVAAHRRIDASGLLVTPGFVDVHTHYDAQATWDATLTPTSWHGVTSIVMGNCGVGFAPAAPDRHEWLVELMEGVEDIPGAAMVEGITWEWETFPQYLDAIERRRYTMDVGVLIGHGAVRAYVMGDRGARDEPATRADLTQMQAIITEALRSGAMGFSSSRTPLHRTKGGELVPGTAADTDELRAIGEAVAAAGHGVFQFSPDHRHTPGEIPWMRMLAEMGVSVSVNVQQTDQAPDLWRETLQLIQESRERGLDIVAQVLGRAVGLLECWEGSVQPFLSLPTWATLAPLSAVDRLAALRRGEVRAALVAEAGALPMRWDNQYLVDPTAIDYEPTADQSVAAVAAGTGRPGAEIAYDHMCAYEGRGMLYLPFFNYSAGDLSAVREFHTHPATRVGLADGGAHVRTICDAGMPTFMLTHWTRDRSRGERLPLEHVIRRQTSETASLYRLANRGVLAPGMRADVNVIDYDRLGFETPRVVSDLPTGASRFLQRARGYVATVLRGTVTVEHDEFTGALPGRLLRGPQG
jgi:N-acyl-D-aspartate/D-glutamate deacylase